MKLLNIYGTYKGQTRRICEFLSEEAKKSRHNVALIEVTENFHNPKNFDAIIIGAPVIKGRLHSDIYQFLLDNKSKLNNVPGIFLVVSLSAASNDPESRNEIERVTHDFLKKTGWHPDLIEHVTGPKSHQLDIDSPLSGLNKIRSKKYTDWQQVKEILLKLEKKIEKAQSESCDPSLYSHAGRYS